MYITTNEIRTFTDLDTEDINDANLNAMIGYATAQLNRDINVRVERELIESIDNVRENKIDSSNKTYYVKNWKKFISDSNNNGEVTISDITVYQVDGDSVETELTVSTITPDSGQFVLSSAPAGGVTLYVTYQYTNVSTHSPDVLVKMACAYMAASLAYGKLNIGIASSFTVGEIRVVQGTGRGSNSFLHYGDLYRELVSRINDELAERVESVDQI